MKFSDEMRFTHPILSEVTGDYGGADFSFKIVVEERPNNGHLRIECESTVTEPDIDACIRNGSAAVGLFVTGAETYYNRLCQVPLGRGTLDFPDGLLRGRVVLRPIIWSVQPLKNFAPKNLHAEFGVEPLQIAKSKLLGIGQEYVISVGHEKLAPLESIFHLAQKANLLDGQILLDLDGPRIKILVNEKAFESINVYRHSSQGRAIILNSIYLPTVMEVLRCLSDDADAYVGFRWYAPFVAKCDYFNIKLEKVEPLEQAQTLLSRPLERLMSEQGKLLP